MLVNGKSWRQLFLFCLGLAAGTAFCMKWMESDLWQNGKKFTIIGLELFYSRREVIGILSGIDDHAKTILRYHLSFDFAFMAGVYPGVAALCMMAREKVRAGLLKKILYTLAALQLLAWVGDIAENCYLFQWINKPAIRNEFGLYHFIVAAKWIIALAGALLAIPLVLKKRDKA